MKAYEYKQVLLKTDENPVAVANKEGFNGWRWINVERATVSQPLWLMFERCVSQQ